MFTQIEIDIIHTYRTFFFLATTLFSYPIIDHRSNILLAFFLNLIHYYVTIVTR